MAKTEDKYICVNRKARHEYFIDSCLEAGIVLMGTEVKSLRLGQANLSDSYAEIRNGEVFLLNANINIYEQGVTSNHDPLRRRKLLLNKKEIRKLSQQVNEKGMTLVALKLYFKAGKVKLELGLGRGKKLYDKRDDIQKRDLQREMERKIKL